MMCDEDDMAQLVASAQADGEAALILADRLIARHPDDARLHFLRGSLLAGGARAIEAHAALARAVALAPDFALARFQLGFFELTSGEAARALDTWAPLGAADDPHYLARFVVGLTHLIHDRFADAVAALQDGIAANQDNPPLSRDMQMVIDACAGQAATPGVAPAPQDSERSATSFLLGQTGGRGPVH